MAYTKARVAAEIWQAEVRSFYPTHTYKETHQHVFHMYGTSSPELQKFLSETGLQRSSEQSQGMKAQKMKQKRWERVCVLCRDVFQGRTPTVLMCDACVGDDSPGATPQRLKKYQHYMRMAAYGIDTQIYDAMFQAQNGLCGLCQCDLRKLASRLIHVDHCHATGVVRGILCQHCNYGLGVLEKRGGQAWLERAQEWLTRSQKEAA